MLGVFAPISAQKSSANISSAGETQTSETKASVTKAKQNIGADCTSWNGAGSGTQNNPYLISNSDNLWCMSTLINNNINPYTKSDTYYSQTDNIDLKGNENNQWVPIGYGVLDQGDSPYAFKGSFNGGNHTISNLYINTSSSNYKWLFGYIVSTSTISNIGIINSTISANKNVGSLVGRNNNGTIKNSYNTGSVIGSSYVGSLVGYNNNGTIKNSYNTGSITGTQNVGGIAGYTYNGIIQNSYNTGTIQAESEAGGIVGADVRNISIKNSVNLSSNITGNSNVNRVFGFPDGSAYLSNN
jgi:hypothetical protein